MKIEQPRRVSHTYMQQLNGSAAAVFSLLCPVREADWIEGWDPDVVYTTSGLAEPDCVFVTGAGAERAVWTVTTHEPETGRVAFVKVTPETAVTRIRIQVTALDEDHCTAAIEYQQTALSPAGEDLVRTFTVEHYQQFMREWEARLNHFLATGLRLTGLPAD
jgi:hypothetical protein